MRVPWKRGLRVAVAAGAVATVVISAAVPSAEAGATPSGVSLGSATHDGMQITGAYVPEPTGSGASVYLVLHNHNAKADKLLSISIPGAAMSMVMGASGRMTTMPSVSVPAHGTFSLRPGHDYVMVQGLTAKLKVGQHVDVRLRFALAGTVTVVAPVVTHAAGLSSSSGSSMSMSA